MPSWFAMIHLTKCHTLFLAQQKRKETPLVQLSEVAQGANGAKGGIATQSVSQLLGSRLLPIMAGINPKPDQICWFGSVRHSDSGDRQ